MKWLPVAVVLALLAMSTPASAELDNADCTAEIQGTDIRDLDPSDKDDAITIEAGDDVTFRLTSGTNVDHWTVRLHYGPFAIPVNRGVPTEGEDGFVHEDQISAGYYDWMGRGLFKISADIERVDGTVCRGAVLIDLEGNPLASLLGVVSLLIVLGAGVGLIITFVKNSEPMMAVRAQRRRRRRLEEKERDANQP